MMRAISWGLVVAGLLLAAPRQASARPPTAPPVARQPPTATTAPAARPPVAAELPVYRDVPAFSYPDQDGRVTTRAMLLGHPWIADFIFTRCTTACPILSARMVMLQRKIGDPNVQFISFSVDPAHDTPAVLKAYASRWAVTEPRWHLLSTNRETLPVFTALLGITAEETNDPDDPIIHSDGFVLVDSTGRVRGAYSSTNEAQLKQLVADVASLTHDERAVPVAPTTALDGRALFDALGCAGCHADAKLGSPLGGLFGSRVRLSDGRTVKADEAYLRESILAPGAKRRDGYPASMPSYAGQLSDGQLSALVDYVKALPGTRTAAPLRQLSIDPVCKMEVSAGPDTPHLERRGKTYWFCSETCRQKFSKSPQRYESH